MLHTRHFKVAEAQVHGCLVALRTVYLGVGEGHVRVLAGCLSSINAAVGPEVVARPEHHGPPMLATEKFHHRAPGNHCAEVRYRSSVIRGENFDGGLRSYVRRPHR